MFIRSRFRATFSRRTHFSNTEAFCNCRYATVDASGACGVCPNRLEYQVEPRITVNSADRNRRGRRNLMIGSKETPQRTAVQFSGIDGTRIDPVSKSIRTIHLFQHSCQLFDSSPQFTRIHRSESKDQSLPAKVPVGVAAERDNLDVPLRRCLRNYIGV